MDNSNPVNPQPAVGTPPPPPAPATEQASPVMGMGAQNPVPTSQNPVIQGPVPMPVQPPVQHEGGSKLIIWLIGGLIIVLLVVAGIYFFMSSQKGPKEQSQPTQTAQPAAKATNQEVQESDVNAVEIDNLDKEFEAVEKDLETL